MGPEKAMGPDRRGPARLPTPSSAVRVGLIVACGVLLTAAALWAGSNGPWVARPESTNTPELPDVTLPTFDPPTLPTIPAPLAPAPAPTWNPTPILYVLGAILLLALLLMAASMVRNRGEAAGVRKSAPKTIDVVEPAVPLVDPDRPFDAREAADYVIACWELLERHAGACGAGRRREQTPTEFVEALQSAYPVDARAAGELLALYQRARFDHVRLAPDTAARARICADAVLAAFGAARIPR